MVSNVKDVELQQNDDLIIHDDLIASLIARIVVAPVTYTKHKPTDEDNGGEKSYELQVDISSTEIIEMCNKMKTSFLSTDALVRIDKESSIQVVADLHGQAVHLLRIFRTCGIPPNQRYLFLGDYVDRGAQGIIVIVLLFCLKYRYPNNVFVLRGNHEDVNTTLNYGFYDECVLRWPLQTAEVVWRACIEVFNTMPVAALIGEKVFCSHGGISPFLSNLEDINKIKRPAIIPAFGLTCDLLWSDPSGPDREGWSLSHRGISFTYGRDVVEEFCKKHKISLIIRGHQLYKELYACGYIVRFGGRLISLFSALNYENHRNNSAVLKIDFKNGMEVSPIVFRCRHYVPLKPTETITFKDLEAIRKRE